MHPPATSQGVVSLRILETAMVKRAASILDRAGTRSRFRLTAGPLARHGADVFPSPPLSSRA
jgi:hypothetical protein